MAPKLKQSIIKSWRKEDIARRSTAAPENSSYYHRPEFVDYFLAARNLSSAH